MLHIFGCPPNMFLTEENVRTQAAMEPVVYAGWSRCEHSESPARYGSLALVAQMRRI